MKLRAFNLRVMGVLASIATSSTSSVAAATPAQNEVSVAQRLFDDALALKQRGNYVEACPKLAESQKLDPGLGTQYHLADCYEKQGRTASAWLLFEEIARQAAVSGQKDRERVARERAEELAPRVPRLLIAVPVTSDAAGLAILRDGELVARGGWNVAVPVDPGAHDIVARTAARTWQTSMVVEPRARTQTVLVPALAAPVPPPSVAVSEGSQETSGSPRRALGIAVTGAGIAGLATGTVFLVKAREDYATGARLGCGSSTCPTQEGVDTRSRAVVAGNVATAAFAIGAVATGAGIYLLLSGRGGEAKARTYASVGPTAAHIGGTF